MAGKPPQKFGSVTRVFPILGWLPSYEPAWLRFDVIAGLTLWGILVPEAIAYAAMATEWVVYAKEVFTGPEQVLAYLARYTHRVAITNRRLLDLDQTHVSFRWKDYRKGGRRKNKVIRIEVGEFMRRFLLHILPNGFHRIRHYGFLANGHRTDKLVMCQNLLAAAPAAFDRQKENDSRVRNYQPPPCPCCGRRMTIVESFNGTLYRPCPVRMLDGL